MDDRVRTVSYTHLDVYKRQLMDSEEKKEHKKDILDLLDEEVSHKND